MSRDIIAEVESSKSIEGGKEVTVRTEKLSPIPSELMVRERARARAIVEAGIADTVSSVFTSRMGVTRLTEVVSSETIDSSYPAKKRFVIEVKQ